VPHEGAHRGIGGPADDEGLEGLFGGAGGVLSGGVLKLHRLLHCVRLGVSRVSGKYDRGGQN
jgi:hypothetical protein